MRGWLKSRSALVMSPTEAAWLAGFIDGEGSVSHFMGGRDKAYPCWRISVPNTDLPSLEKCRRITGSGSIHQRKPSSRPAHHKVQHQWMVNAQRDVAAICTQILPYSVTKRAAIEAFLASWRDLELAA